MSKKNIFCFLIGLIIDCGFCFAQTSNIDGVYAGVVANANAGSIKRSDVAILFRKDKTFTDKLKEKDWKTATKGTYKQSGDQLVLNYSNKKVVTYKITKNGNLSRRGSILTKFSAKEIPRGSFEYKNASSSGGTGTNQDFIGSSSSKLLSFDGKRNFTTSKSSATTVIGSQVGGGTKANSKDGGTYSFADNELILKFKDGQSDRYSCFVSKPVGRDGYMLLINGVFYFNKK